MSSRPHPCPAPVIHRLRGIVVLLLGGLGWAAHATPLAPPSILTEPDPVSLRAGARLTLRVRASGSAPLTYGWSHNFSPIPDATNDTYTVEAVTAADAGTYAVGVTNRYGFIHSRDVEVMVFTPPTFTESPRSKTVEAGDYFILDAQATGTPPLFYSWSRDGTPVSGVSELNYFAVNPATPLDDGLYSVIASNRWGTATSTVARVTVYPAPPNADYLGRRFVTLARTGMPVQGSVEPLGQVARPLGARWQGREVIFSTFRPGLRKTQLVRAGLGGVSLVLPNGTTLPNALGQADGFALPDGAVSTDPLYVVASTNLSFSGFAGVYGWNGPSLESLVDLHTPVPDAPEETFQGFTAVVQRGADLALLGYTGRRYGLYLRKNGVLRRLLDTTQELPIAGRQAQGFYALGWDGSTAAVALWSDQVGFVTAVQVTPDGQAHAFLEAGDLLPDTRRVVRDLERLVVQDGVVYGATARSADGGESIFEWRSSELRSRLYPGLVVDAWGGVGTFEARSFAVNGGQILAAAGSVPSNFAIRTDFDGHQRLFLDRKLDGTQVSASYPLCAEMGRVALVASFGPNEDAVCANLPWVLRMERVGNLLRLQVPDGQFLETSDQPTGPWRPLPSTETFDVPASGPSRYYRLREP